MLSQEANGRQRGQPHGRQCVQAGSWSWYEHQFRVVDPEAWYVPGTAAVHLISSKTECTSQVLGRVPHDPSRLGLGLRMGVIA
jgi:hypothetical protein